MTVGMLGDFHPESATHCATSEAVHHAAQAFGPTAMVSWLPPSALRPGTVQRLRAPCDALWAAPGRPYVRLAGALCGSQCARERDRPFFGT